MNSFTLFTVVCLAAASADSLTLYKHYNFAGPTVEIAGAQRDLGELGFDEMVSSYQVGKSTWACYQDASYSGQRLVLSPGEKKNVPSWWNDKMSSCRPYRLVLHKHYNFQGPILEIDQEQADLGDLGFGKMVSSYEALEGPWECYQGANFEGKSLIIEAGDKKNVPSSWNDKMTSCRPAVSTSGLTLYMHYNFAGPTVEIDGAQPDLGELEFDNTVSSYQVGESTWACYQDASYNGVQRLVLSPGEKKNVPSAWNDKMSSCRPYTLVLYKHYNFQGPILEVDQEQADLGDLGFGKMVSSYEALEGPWACYQGANFEGEALIIEAGDKKNVPSSWNDKMTSCKPVEL